MGATRVPPKHIYADLGVVVAVVVVVVAMDS